MPFLKLNTNVAISEPQNQQLLTELSQLMASHTSKPENYVMIQITGGLTMSFAGNNQALAYMECKSIGLSSLQVKTLSDALTKYISLELMIPGNRIYIEFTNCPAELWAWNGKAFA